MGAAMISNVYYEVLDISPEAGLAEVKAAYYRAAKRNHPDLFPESERKRREMRMMQINEAYMAIVCNHADGGTESSSQPVTVTPQPTGPRPEAKAVGQLRDPAYTYYKLGFKYFSEGRRTLSKHYLSGGQRIDFSTENIHVLRLAVASLHYFHKAYGCFEKVSSHYSASVWARDSRVKIFYLNRYNVIYHRICDNLSRQISTFEALRVRSTQQG